MRTHTHVLTHARAHAGPRPAAASPPRTPRASTPSPRAPRCAGTTRRRSRRTSRGSWRSGARTSRPRTSSLCRWGGAGGRVRGGGCRGAGAGGLCFVLAGRVACLCLPCSAMRWAACRDMPSCAAVRRLVQGAYTLFQRGRGGGWARAPLLTPRAPRAGERGRREGRVQRGRSARCAHPRAGCSSPLHLRLCRQRRRRHQRRRPCCAAGRAPAGGRPPAPARWRSLQRRAQPRRPARAPHPLCHAPPHVQRIAAGEPSGQAGGRVCVGGGGRGGGRAHCTLPLGAQARGAHDSPHSLPLPSTRACVRARRWWG